MPWATAFRITWINGSASRWTTPASTSVLAPEKTTAMSLPPVRAISRTAFWNRVNNDPMGTIRVRAISSRRSVVICWSRPMSSRALWIEVLSWAITSLTSADTSVRRRARMLKSSYLSNSSAPKLADRASGDWLPSPVPVVAGKVKACFSSNVRTVSSIRLLYAWTWRANCSRTVKRCSKRLRPMTNSPTRLSSRSRRSRLTRTVPWLISFAPTGCGWTSGSTVAGAGGSAVAGGTAGSSSRGGWVSVGAVVVVAIGGAGAFSAWPVAA